MRKSSFALFSITFLMVIFTGSLSAQTDKIDKFADDEVGKTNTPAPKVHKSGFQLHNIQLGFSSGYTFSDYDYVAGGDVMLSFDLTEKTYFTTSVGFTNYAISGRRDATFLPVKFGFKYYMTPKFFMLPEIGTAVRLGEVKWEDYVYAYALGFTLNKVDLSLRYEDNTNFDGSQLTLRVAYSF